jgi:hypothetical protein
LFAVLGVLLVEDDGLAGFVDRCSWSVAKSSMWVARMLASSASSRILPAVRNRRSRP